MEPGAGGARGGPGGARPPCCVASESVCRGGGCSWGHGVCERITTERGECLCARFVDVYCEPDIAVDGKELAGLLARVLDGIRFQCFGYADAVQACNWYCVVRVSDPCDRDRAMALLGGSSHEWRERHCSLAGGGAWAEREEDRLGLLDSVYTHSSCCVRDLFDELRKHEVRCGVPALHYARLFLDEWLTREYLAFLKYVPL